MDLRPVLEIASERYAPRLLTEWFEVL